MASELDGFKLGRWVSNQRTRRDSVTPDQLKRSEDIGFVWDVLEYQWEEGFSYLTRFKEKYGDCLVPNAYRLDGYKLGQWVIVQRRRKDSSLPTD